MEKNRYVIFPLRSTKDFMSLFFQFMMEDQQDQCSRLTNYSIAGGYELPFIAKDYKKIA